MKALYLFLVALLMLVSCAEIRIEPRLKEIDPNILNSGIKELAYDILDKPEKLRNFKDNYPQFYDSLVILSDMHDTSWISKSIVKIKENINHCIFGYGMEEIFLISERYDIQNLYFYEKKINIDTSEGKIFMLSLMRKDRGLWTYFTKKDSKYLIIDIRYVQVNTID